MRYPPDHKNLQRQRIIRAAARRFRSRGSRGVPIPALMRDLKLTHGGFYRHFAGKEELFGEALVESVSEVGARMSAAGERAPAGHELEAVIRAYLSPEHCTNPAEGCPIAALGAEVARHPESTRTAFGRAVREHAAALARFAPGSTVAERQRAAMVLFAGMSGVLNVARATSDEALRDTILEDARAFYIAALCRRS
jgi:TetR/AcrR family transcriptional repressor of nem operon